MRLIDADALIADLEYDVERDAKALDSIDSVGRDWETIWFDKNCKQNAIDLLQHAPTIEPEIVRCKDCEYGKQDEYGRWYCRGFGCQVGDEDGNGFCSDAERKNNV